MDLPPLQYLLLALLALNVAAFLLFGYDKVKAMKREWRVPEGTLLLLALIGPFGAYLGMKVFHHKTRKLKFLIVPIFMIFQIFLLIYLTSNII